MKSKLCNLSQTQITEDERYPNEFVAQINLADTSDRTRKWGNKFYTTERQIELLSIIINATMQ